jgi:hypothetical protein
MHFVRNSLTMVFWHLTSVTHSPECHRVLGQAQHPSGSPSALLGLAPCNFLIYPRLKNTLKGKLFQDTMEIKLNETWQLQAIPKHTHHTCYGKWKDQWNCCRKSGVLHFTGDESQ